MKKIIRGFFCVFFLFLSVMMPVQGEELDLYAGAAVLMDADSGRVLYGKNEDTFMAMASTTKIMTCILVLEKTSPEDMLTVSAYAASMPKVKLGIQRGEQYSVGDLLYSLMLESHNDTAAALAEYVGKAYLSEELSEKDTAAYTADESKKAVAAFAVLMNQKARELGCENTWFITPNGLDATETLVLEDGSTLQKEHGTTARELARILAYCIRESPCRDDFLRITRTGYYSYVGALERDDRTFVVALLACGWPNNKSYKWSDTRKLMQYGIDNYFYRSFSEPGVAFDAGRLGAVPVHNGRTEYLGTEAFVDVRVADGADRGDAAASLPAKEGLLMREDEDIRVEYTVADRLTAPVASGMPVGRIDYIVDDTVYRRELIVTANGLDEIDQEWCMRQVLRRFVLP